jgi:hypothetical protein
MKPELCLELRHFQNMYPDAEIHLEGKQLYWETENGHRQHSITYYDNTRDYRAAKRTAFGMNEVKFLGNYRFASTYTS